jgi:hypothetical protein
MRPMSRDKRLSRPVYEALPWVYILCGLAGLVASYFSPSGLMSFLLGVPGLVALVGGIVVLLRRRDFRKMRADYSNSDSTLFPKSED